MKQVWIGKYIDVGGKGIDEEFTFRIDADMTVEMSFSGHVWEKEFYEEAGLFISVVGFIDENHISFVKSYPKLFGIDKFYNSIIDTKEKGYEVTYDGFWNDEKSLWEGTWQAEDRIFIDGKGYYTGQTLSGPFDMKLLKDE